MAPPDIWQINNSAGGGNGVKLVEAVTHNLALLSLMVWFPEGMAEGPAQKNGARRFYLLAVFSDDTDTDGGDTGLLNNPLNQSHGLVADASAGG